MNCLVYKRGIERDSGGRITWMLVQHMKYMQYIEILQGNNKETGRPRGSKVNLYQGRGRSIIVVMV